MKRGRVIAAAVMTAGVLSIGRASGEEIITDIPGSSEHSGTIYGSIYEGKEEEKPKGDEDIEVEIPAKPEQPGNSGGSGNQGNTGNGGNESYGNSGTQSTGGNRETTEGEGRSEEEGEYRWEEERGVLVIKKRLLERAKEEKKGVVIRILNEEGKAEYRIRIEEKDIESHDLEDIRVDMGSCPHREEIAGKIGKEEKVSSILLCQQEEEKIAMKIAVAVDKSWDREYGVYRYEYRGSELKYIDNGVGIDSESMVEIELEAGKDTIFSEKGMETRGKTIQSFVEGLSGKNEEVDRSKGMAAVVLGAAGVSAGGVGIWRYLKRRRIE